MTDNLVRDENGEPVRVLVERDKAGRFIRPYYGFIYAAPKTEDQRNWDQLGEDVTS